MWKFSTKLQIQKEKGEYIPLKGRLEEIYSTKIAPLHPGIVNAARIDAKFYELISLVDALRIGRTREQSFVILGHMIPFSRKDRFPMLKEKLQNILQSIVVR